LRRRISLDGSGLIRCFLCPVILEELATKNLPSISNVIANEVTQSRRMSQNLSNSPCSCHTGHRARIHYCFLCPVILEELATKRSVQAWVETKESCSQIPVLSSLKYRRAFDSIDTSNS